MNVVLLHGIFDTARIFKPLIAILESAGHTCFAPSMKPADARHGIHDLAAFVARFVDLHVPHGEPFSIVGFSMGGLLLANICRRWAVSHAYRFFSRFPARIKDRCRPTCILVKGP